MIPIALSEKLNSLNFIRSIEVSHMTRHSIRSNKLRNVNPVRVRMGNVTIVVFVESLSLIHHRFYPLFVCLLC